MCPVRHLSSREDVIQHASKNTQELQVPNSEFEHNSKTDNINISRHSELAGALQ